MVWQNLSAECAAPTRKLQTAADILGRRLDALLRGDATDLEAYLIPVGDVVVVPNSRARIHCKLLMLDGRGLPRADDLARFIANRVVDYAIPRSELRNAQKRDAEKNTTANVASLRKRAEKLFVASKATGEGGELLLYTVVQTYLRLPQLFCKMSLKTNPDVHIHGTDGIHVGISKSDGSLVVYWGESKLYAQFRQALRTCFDDIKPFLCSGGGSTSTIERDLQLVRDGIDLDDDALNKAVLRFLDPDDPKFGTVSFAGLCLVGFDHSAYPGIPNVLTNKTLLADVERDLKGWAKTVEELLVERDPLHRIDIQVFMIPLPSVQAFRTAFLREIGNG